MFFVSLWKVVIPGIIEGIIEWLPIGNTGHLILVDESIKLGPNKGSTEMFSVIIQLGAIMTVVILYFHGLNPFSLKKDGEEKKDTWTLWSKVLVTCLPAVVIGPKFNDYLDACFYNLLTVPIILIVYETAFIITEKWDKDVTPKCINLKDFIYEAASTVGTFQVPALIPGTSRSGTTILRAILIGVSHFVTTEFSSFLGIPVMFGASFLKIFRFPTKGNMFRSEKIIILIAGSTAAFVVSIITAKLLLNYPKKNDLTAFGWYRIALGTILVGYWLLL